MSSSPPSSRFERTQLLRVILGYLDSLGYDKSVRVLEEESGCELVSANVLLLRGKLLQGQWDEAIKLMGTVRMEPGGEVSAREAILTRKYVEILRSGDTLSAISCLQNELAPITSATENLNALASLILLHAGDRNGMGSVGGNEDYGSLCTAAVRFGLPSNLAASFSSRQALVGAVEACFVPGEREPSKRRLEELTAQALKYQIAGCRYHNVPQNACMDLYRDHLCSRESIPQTTCLLLEGHICEVWMVKFSPDGQRLATSSSDGTIIIWDVSKPHRNSERESMDRLILEGPEPPLSLAWSPDGRRLLSGAGDSVVREWCTSTGKVLAHHTQHTDAVTAVTWLPAAGAGFVSGSLDRQILLWSSSGSVMARWSGLRVRDMAISSDGSWLMALCGGDATLRLLQIRSGRSPAIEQLGDVDFGDACGSPILAKAIITSITPSPSSDCVLFQTQGGGLCCWDIHAKQCIASYSGHLQKRYILRPCFGGTNDGFVASGSEDGKVYIWNRQGGNLVASLSGHAGTVNAVAWSPSNPCILASVSDDRTVRVWSSLVASPSS
jgi:WD40 repeat protein